MTVGSFKLNQSKYNAPFVYTGWIPPDTSTPASRTIFVLNECRTIFVLNECRIYNVKETGCCER